MTEEFQYYTLYVVKSSTNVSMYRFIMRGDFTFMFVALHTKPWSGNKIRDRSGIYVGKYIDERQRGIAKYDLLEDKDEILSEVIDNCRRSLKMDLSEDNVRNVMDNAFLQLMSKGICSKRSQKLEEPIEIYMYLQSVETTNGEEYRVIIPELNRYALLSDKEFLLQNEGHFIDRTF